MYPNTKLPPELEDWRVKIEAWSREYGLDFYTTIYEVLDWDQMNMVAAYGGFPTRYPHWRWGLEYEQLSKSSEYGLSKIYELVINANPAYGFLLEGNSVLQNKLVVAHVLAHCDFFKNNIYFRHTSRQMIESASVTSGRDSINCVSFSSLNFPDR